MKLKQYDDIELNREVKELAELGIHKGCFGVIAKLGEKKSLILFFNPEDLGDYAYAYVENDDLLFCKRQEEPFRTEFEQYFASHDPTKKTSFEPTLLREYDTVRVIVERPQYAKAGVHKGMVGTILNPEKIGGCWDVYFEDEEYADTINCPIRETDMELINRVNDTTDQ